MGIGVNVNVLALSFALGFLVVLIISLILGRATARLGPAGALAAIVGFLVGYSYDPRLITLLILSTAIGWFGYMVFRWVF